MKKRILVLSMLVFSIALFNGCAQRTVWIEYNSIPDSASLYTQYGEFLGETPLVKKYYVTDQDLKSGYFFVPRVTVRWLSGAKSYAHSFNAKIGDYRIYTIRRPSSAPNLRADVEYANGKRLQMQTENQRKSREQDGILGLGLLCVLSGHCR